MFGKDTTIIQSEAKCSPCFNIVDECMRDGANDWMLCVGKIAPERVIEAIDSVLL